MKRALPQVASDAVLMREVQAGESVAMGKLYERLAMRAFRTALSVCHDSDCAQDAVQDAFASMWSSRSTYQPARGSVAGWAMTIVRHRAIYLARRRSLAAGREEGPARLERQPAPDDIAADCAAKLERERLAQHLTRLPAAQREVIQLGFFDGLTHQQIARKLALPPGTVKGRMRLGLTKLRSELAP